MIEEIRSWQKVEPDSRDSEDISKGLQATIHDPLWMLARQWQLGEFEGEDAGSPISVSVSAIQHKISKILISQKSFDYDENIPLEVYIERTKPEIAMRKSEDSTDLELQLDLQTRVKLGLQFQREIDILLKSIVSSKEQIKGFKSFLAKEKELAFADLNARQAEFEIDITKEYLSVIKGRVIDIYKIFKTDGSILELKAKNYFKLNDNDRKRIAEALKTAFQNTKYWWEGNISTTQADKVEKEEPFFEMPKNDDNNNLAWDPKHLEYSFGIQIGTDDNNRIVLDASEYKEDHLDWYSFTVDQKKSAAQIPVSSSSPIFKCIPTHLKFAGMPEKRWWNFEDSHVDFGSITPKTNNIVSTLMMEFALVHSPDWYIVPHQMEVGMISQIESFIVRDCFGDETPIEPAGRTSKEQSMTQSDNSWDSWSMFSLSKTYEDQGQQRNTPYFFLPPTVDNPISGPPLEEVKFLRDEMANLTWAVEKQFRTLYGEPVSAYDHYLSRKKKLLVSSQNLPSDGAAAADNTTIDNNKKEIAKYTLMASIPWNWIPFIPVHTTKFLSGPSPDSSSHMLIELQRAAMVNPITGTTPIRLIRPNTRLLNEVQPRYYIDESEIPRSGAIISEKCQRTVWSNGRVFLWIGRKKMVGSGEGSSGLKFDSIPLRKKI